MNARARWIAVASATLGGAIAALAAACGPSTKVDPVPGDCRTNPTMCREGTTCWPVNDPSGALAFACVQSNPSYGFRSACELTVGIATCGDNMACDTSQGDAGVCTYYCDSSRSIACPAPYTCQTIHVGGAGAPTVEVCR